jgi:hypothetical protein
MDASVFRQVEHVPAEADVDEAAALDPRQVQEAFRDGHGPVLDPDRLVAEMLPQRLEMVPGQGILRQHGCLVGGIEVGVDGVADEPELPRRCVVYPEPEGLQAVSREVHAEMLRGLLVREDGDRYRDVVDGLGLDALQIRIERQRLRLVARAGAEHCRHREDDEACRQAGFRERRHDRRLCGRKIKEIHIGLPGFGIGTVGAVLEPRSPGTGAERFRRSGSRTAIARHRDGTIP